MLAVAGAQDLVLQAGGQDNDSVSALVLLQKALTRLVRRGCRRGEQQRQLRAEHAENLR